MDLSVSDSGLPPNLSEKVYRIVDLVTSNVTDYTRADFYNGKFGRFEDVVSTNYFDFATTKTCELDDVFIWTDVTNHEEYLTTKIVLRRIPAGGKTYTMQAGTDSAHAVSFEKDFYLGIYEVSEGQYSNAVRQVADCRKPYPMNTSYKAYIGSNWLDYPEKDRTEQQPGGFLNWLRVKTKPSGTYYFHLPTEAEWEFACRAGYTGSSCYTGGAYNDCEWHSRNADGNQHPAGQKTPNAFGLYDMLGVNHLAYGRNGLGYGMILKGTHDLDPELVRWQKEIGFGSLRYPGGCGGTHRFEWKRNAGLSGPYYVMGVVEFLAMCESCGAQSKGVLD